MKKCFRQSGSMNKTIIEPEKNGRLRQLADMLQMEIRGQRHIIPRVVSVLQRGELGLSKAGRPRGSFYFSAPRVSAKRNSRRFSPANFSAWKKLVRYDMSEFQTQESLGLLLGSRPGEKGFLGAAYERTKTGTCCFDEVEKAHPRIMDVFPANAGCRARHHCDRRDARLERILYRDDFQHWLRRMMTLQHSGGIHARTPCPFPRSTIIAPGNLRPHHGETGVSTV